MIIKLLKTGRDLELTQHEYDTLIVAQGHAHKYRIVEDGAPIEVKQMRKEKFEKKIKSKND